jgi:hypothetical protein
MRTMPSPAPIAPRDKKEKRRKHIPGIMDAGSGISCPDPIHQIVIPAIPPAAVRKRLIS